MQNPIICALDTKELSQAKKICEELKPYIGMVKLGLEFFTINGPDGVREITASGVPVFLDLKFHDIPNTVAEAVKSAIRLGVQIITIHTLGGKDMMQAAARAATEEAKKNNIERPIIVGVTVLTSMDEDDLQAIGINKGPKEQVEILAKLAKESGLDGIVCSPHEVETVKALCGNGFKTVVPGIRPESAATDDQKRVMTPKKAVTKGADYLVIGRPITKAENPVESAKFIQKSLIS